jgi:nitrite reductase/ring-hydroxylating ferredoxin subunit
MTFAMGWHPVALSASLDPGSSAGTHIDGAEYVVWRDNSGVAHVWQDRCPHRGMKLSFGFVRGDHIACLYHGWQYDTNGRCRYVPAHPDLEVPATITVPVFATIEACGMIWTCAEPEAARPAAPADVGEVTPVRSLYVDNGADALLQAVRTNLPSPLRGDGPPAIAPAGDNLWRITTGADTLLVGLQSIADNRAALHVAIAGPASVYAGAGQTHYLGWTADLRYALKHEPESAGAAARAEAV